MNTELMEIKPASIVALFETTKEQRISFADQLMQDIEDGRKNPLEVHAQIKGMEDVVKEITGRDTYKKYVLDEALTYGQKSFQFHNAKIEIKEVGVKWDYSQCNDTTLSEMQQQADALSAKIKDRQKFLQTIPECGMADPETGNMIYRAAKQSTTSVAITLK